MDFLKSWWCFSLHGLTRISYTFLSVKRKQLLIWNLYAQGNCPSFKEDKSHLVFLTTKSLLQISYDQRSGQE